MARKTISISIPESVIDEFDLVRGEDESRSGVIAGLMAMETRRRLRELSGGDRGARV